MRRQTVFLTLLCLTAASVSASDAELLERALDRMSGHRADFTQTLSLDGLDDARTESGTVLFGVAPRMRWTYSSPTEKHFVFDGKTSWLYLPGERQVLVHEITRQERSSLPILFFEDPNWIERNYRISSRRNGKLRLVELRARNDSLLEVIVARIDEAGMLRSLEWKDRDGNVTRFTLKNFRKTGARPGEFAFSIPSGVDVIRN